MFTMMLCAIMLVSLVGCGTQTTTTETGKTTASANLEVIELISAPVSYDGKAKTAGSGPDSVTTKLSISKDGTITDVKNTFVEGYPKSKQYQTAFEGAIAKEIVGKNIKDAKVTVVAGASATSLAFNAALDDLRKKANY